MTKGRDGTKKAPKPKAAAKAPKKPSPKPAAKPSPKPSPKPAAKATPKARAKAPAKPSAAKAVAAKGGSARPATARPTAGKPAVHGPAASKAAPAKAAPALRIAKAPTPVAPAKPAAKAEAPKPFQREYKKWLERLISLRRQLVQDGERLGEEGLKALEQEVSVDHMADFGSDSYEQDTTLSLIENKSDALRDVDEAIRRIDVKTYGLCEECEQLIPPGRLEVIPHARYCVKCQGAREGTG